MPGILSRLRGQTETTPVSSETEVLIPWQTYGRLLILGPVSIWAFWFSGCIIWLGKHLVNGYGFWRWVTRFWWPWMGRWWWMPMLLCFLWWASAPTWATIYRYIIETMIKNPPLYKEWDPIFGWWHPFKRVQQAPKVSLSVKLKDLLDLVGLEILEEDEADEEEDEE